MSRRPSLHARLARFVPVGLVAVAVAALSPAAAHASIPIPSRTYEEGLAPWGSTNGATVTHETAETRWGTGAAKVVTAAVDYSGIRSTGSANDAVVDPSKPYTLSVYAKAPGGISLNLRVSQLTADGSLITKTTQRGLSGTGDWARYTLTFTTASTAGRLRDFRLYSRSATVSTLLVDGWQLDEGTTALAYDGADAAGTEPPPAGDEVVVAAAGDIASTPTDSAGTAALLAQIAPDRVLTLGDNAYEEGTLEEYLAFYDPNWGAFKAITSPVPGNHEYRTSGAAGYFDYFGARVPAAYYSYDLGAWHLIALNSEIPMGEGSAQLQWLEQDLAATGSDCTLAYFHRPRFSSGSVHGSDTSVAPLWRALHAAGADLVLSGHEHNYERFAPQDPDGVADPAGIRQFVVGTGGRSLYGFGDPIPNSEVRDDSTDGVLRLALTPGGYAWRFLPVAGGSFTDEGTGTCTGEPNEPGTTLSVTAEADARTDERAPYRTYGTATTLRVDGGAGTHVESHLRFTVPAGATNSVARAILQVNSTGYTADGPAVYGADTAWTESTVTWATRPARTTAALADTARIRRDTWAEWDVSEIVTGPGTYALTLAGESTDGIEFHARESASLQPRLVVTYD